MATKLFVGSLPYSIGDDDLANLFNEFGDVVSAKVIVDRDSNRSKGFGFVEMSSDDEAKAAIKEMDGKDVSGRSINVSEARPQQPRSPRREFGGDNRNNGGSFRSRY